MTIDPILVELATIGVGGSILAALAIQKLEPVSSWLARRVARLTWNRFHSPYIQAMHGHPWRHPLRHTHQGIDSCFICEEHAEMTGCTSDGLTCSRSRM